MNVLQDRCALRLLNHLLPEFVTASYFADPGSTLAAYAEASYDRLLVVHQQLVRHPEDEFGDYAVSFMRPPESQKSLLHRLAKAVSRTIMQADPTGVLICELLTIHNELLAIQQRGDL
ncbi:hypothetical protein ACO2Q9_02635 [Variovorax sp. VNK109]|uniref:hypothetical protein n=1 Tax=Variovorax sp. VNK109 TaxID=3400919 RepID=UPI003C0B8B6B